MCVRTMLKMKESSLFFLGKIAFLRPFPSLKTHSTCIKPCTNLHITFNLNFVAILTIFYIYFCELLEISSNWLRWSIKAGQTSHVRVITTGVANWVYNTPLKSQTKQPLNPLCYKYCKRFFPAGFCLWGHLQSPYGMTGEGQWWN